MKFLEPVQRIGNQEVAYFVATKVKNVGAPVLMLAQTRIFVLIQCRAIKTGQRKEIFGKMRRYPVQKHANTMLVTMIDKVAEIIRRTKAAGRGKITRGLVTP